MDAPGPTPLLRLARRIIATFLILAGTLSVGYLGISSYVAEQLVYRTPTPIQRTPASLGLRFANVTFPSREDHLVLKGWFIPGVLPDGRLTADRTIVVVHGTWANREDRGDKQLELTGDLARRGLAILAFDMRGMGESPPAPLSFGYYEQRDVLGAVDYLRAGPLAFPELGRPRAIGGLGVSMGAATLLIASANEPSIKAVVSDSAYAEIVPLIERDLSRYQVAVIGSVPWVFAPSALVMARLLYGVDYFAVRPVDSVAGVAPRPLLLIHGARDEYIPVINFDRLHKAASSPPTSQVTSWLVPKARHAQGYKIAGGDYVTRVGRFFDAALGPDQRQPGAIP
jgi:fermentation-respiration switch protein FrsA (DUF1100 family)